VSEVDGPIRIRPARADDVIDLRHAVLREGLARETAIFPGDDDPAARHFIAVAADDTIVACVTLHPSTCDGQPAWQLRGMAVAPQLRGSGIGARLLRAVEQSVAADEPRRILWCNARVPARAFYERHGWRAVSEIFHVPTAGPHVRMVRVT
jgi:predicted GNAT family N-acyltransferase